MAMRPNVFPYFIGVFDTVASLANPGALAGLIALVPALTALVSWLAWLILLYFGITVAWWKLFVGLTVVVAVVGWLANLLARIRVASGLEKFPGTARCISPSRA